MNHKYSTVFLILVILFTIIFSAYGYLTSDEIDGGFNCSNNSILYKYNDSTGWNCASIIDQNVFNITVNNVTYIYNNYSLYANNTQYVRGLEIDSTNVTNWNTAYGWGNHALAGYLTNINNTKPKFDMVGIENTTPQYPIHFSGVPQASYIININMTKSSAGTFSPLYFKAGKSSDTKGVGNIIIASLYGVVDDLATSFGGNTYIEGQRFEIGKQSASQNNGTRTLRGSYYDIQPVSSIGNSNGTVTIEGVSIYFSPISSFTPNNGAESFYGTKIVRATPYVQLTGTRTYDSYGLYIDGFDKGDYERNSYAIWVDDGTSRFDDGNFTSRLQALDYYSGNNSQGRTAQLNITGCNITFVDGLMTSWVGCGA